ncbi:MAG TPA: hypothetical protein VFH68_00695 [Polyangia bacterium]|nr:hypothetical protein [Polyangia bacterium]
MLQRWWIAVALSIAAHVAVVGGIVGWLFVNGLTFNGRIDVEISGMRLDEVHDLPLGPPPSVAEHPATLPRSPPRRRAPQPPASEGVLMGTTLDGPASAAEEAALDEGASKATSLRQYGPEGSRVTVLLRLDRLRGTSYVPALDALLGRLPDRRDLLEGTGLDLFQTFDALLIATPNPLDYTVTFLAAQHRLKDTELRAALERGAKVTGRVLTWRTEGRRPFAERHARAPAGAPPPPGTPRAISRDERLIVLPAPGLVVVTPPSYRSLLLASMKPRPAPPVRDAGAGGDAVGEARAGSAEAAAAARAAAADAGGSGSGPEPQWGALLRRLDAENGIMPPDAVALLSAIDIFSARSLSRAATILGLPVPKVLTAAIGTEPSPFVDVKAEMADEAQARRWEAEWPALHQRLKTNPYVLLTGFGALVARAELERNQSQIHLRQTATEAETLRLLQLAARLLGAEPVATP